MNYLEKVNLICTPRAIYLDMDGTFVDLYGVDGWLEDLRSEDVRPYAVAHPLVKLSALARVLNRLQRNGYTINIISWTSRGGSRKYNEAVAETKREWLAHHLPSVRFDSINIVDYGTPKSLCGDGILFDDEEHNREDWNGTAFSEKRLMEVLKALV